MQMLKIGKLSNEMLKNIVLDKLHTKRTEVVLKPDIGEDCCAIDFGENLCILSSDPVTGTDKQIGAIAVHICCNDIASSGAEPIGLMVTLLIPAFVTESQIQEVISQISDTADDLNIDIVGGHTEVTDAVNRIVISGTGIGKVSGKKLIASSGAREGDILIMTKTAGIEGTAILANDFETSLIRVFGIEMVEKAKGYIRNISVVKEGTLSASYEVDAMHDATEGGILGAAWEIAEASGLGVDIYADKIPVSMETEKICGYFNISPLRLISSGSMLIACNNDVADQLLILLKGNKIDACVIGRFNNTKNRILITGMSFETINSPGPDELYNLEVNNE